MGIFPDGHFWRILIAYLRLVQRISSGVSCQMQEEFHDNMHAADIPTTFTKMNMTYIKKNTVDMYMYL